MFEIARVDCIWGITDVIVIFNFRLYFALLPPSQPEKSKLKTNEKDGWRYYHFTIVYEIS